MIKFTAWIGYNILHKDGRCWFRMPKSGWASLTERHQGYTGRVELLRRFMVRLPQSLGLGLKLTLHRLFPSMVKPQPILQMGFFRAGRTTALSISVCRPTFFSLNQIRLK